MSIYRCFNHLHTRNSHFLESLFQVHFQAQSWFLACSNGNRVKTIWKQPHISISQLPQFGKQQRLNFAKEDKINNQNRKESIQHSTTNNFVHCGSRNQNQDSPCMIYFRNQKKKKATENSSPFSLPNIPDIQKLVKTSLFKQLGLIPFTFIN